MTNRERIMLMPRWKAALFGIALVAVPATAHAGGTVPVEEPAASRVASARELIAILLPAEQRDAMMEQMISAMLANVAAGMKQRPEVGAAFEDPRISAVFDRFLTRIQVDATNQLKSGMPDLTEAMARAYARRFSEDQLGEMKAFFSTPTGQAYIRASTGIMSDPDVAAWSRQSMAKSFDRMPQQLDQLKREIEDVLGRPLQGNGT